MLIFEIIMALGKAMQDRAYYMISSLHEALT